mmetsp:Transcript_29087/g.64070  ORF Transcript_29087/g.64070 Transcript_29087/m.64070 type:complete len:311 (-) Transcript_29087:83-1015(-)
MTTTTTECVVPRGPSLPPWPTGRMSVWRTRPTTRRERWGRPWATCPWWPVPSRPSPPRTRRGRPSLPRRTRARRGGVRRAPTATMIRTMIARTPRERSSRLIPRSFGVNTTTLTTKRPWRGTSPTRNPSRGSSYRTPRVASWPTCPCPNGARGRARSSPAPPRPSTSPATVRSPGGYPVSSIGPPRASRMPNPSAFAPRSSTLRAANPRRWSLPLPTPTRARLSSYPKPPSVSSSPPGICSASPLGICTGLRTIPRPTIASCSGPSSVLLLVMRSGVSDDVLHIYFVYTFVHLVIVNARECCGDISYFEF